VVALRVEGAPAEHVYRLLSPLMGIVQDVYATMPRNGDGEGGERARPFTLPIFPGATDLGGARLSAEQIPAAKQAIGAGRYPLEVRRQVDQILDRARSVTLSRWRAQQGVKEIVAFYRRQMAERGAGVPLVTDASDPS
jgi:hypothetical protein